MPNTTVHYYGIRHHGPGSAKRLIAALDQLQPKKVLIEGPADCSELLPMLAHQQMKPPVALLAYVAEQSSCSLYYPFAEYSPEYQACLWAVQHNAELLFIDLPVNIQLAQRSSENSDNTTEDSNAESTVTLTQPPMCDDPIGALAELAGYEDGEAWWNDLIEQNNDDDTSIFTTVESAMTALRQPLDESDTLSSRDKHREAYMRLEIAKAQKAFEGDIAVVCGAWHVPAFKEKHTAKADRALLKTLPAKLTKSKIRTAWIPWTSPRLATISGYGAGVSAPMWYQHLWQQNNHHQALEYWLAKVSHALRESGQIVSTASVIEAVRLSTSLAAVRNRPSPGFEEIREAVIACLCFGERIVWEQIEETLLLGNEVGTIPENAPLMPLLEDLQRQQKKYKLKPEALDKELSLDLRTDAGIGKSTVLHRLSILDVPWGSLTNSGNSRGTFRERWVLRWQPEYAVRLLENLVYGSTIEEAANSRLCELLTAETNLSKLAETVQLSLEAQLETAAEIGLSRLDDRAAHTSDAIELLDSLAPLIQIHRYGTARDISLTHVETLINRLAIQSALALPYACRNLNNEESSHYCGSINQANQALRLAETDEAIMEDWWQALMQVTNASQSSPQVCGLCARLLYLAQKMDEQSLQRLLQKALSPALPATDAAHFFEGFFADAVERLLYDSVLMDTIEQWLIQLEEETFIEFLPLFRRVFSGLDASERKRMLDTVLGGRPTLQFNKAVNKNLLSQWPNHLQRIGKLLQRDKSWTQ